MNKKEDFISVNEYQENQERSEKIKNIFNLVINRNISFIIYFLLTFLPGNIAMLFKNLLSYSDMKTYFIDFITIFLISFSGSFIFCVRLFDPLMRAFIFNLLSFNREFLSNYKEQLLKEKALDESISSNNVSDIYNVHDDSFMDNKLKIRRNSKKSKTIYMKNMVFNFGKNKNKINGICSVVKIGESSQIFEMNNFNESKKGIYDVNSNFISSGRNDTFSNLNELEENYYVGNQDYSNSKKENLIISSKSKNEIETNSINETGKNKNDSSQQEKNKNNLYASSFGSADKKNINDNKFYKYRNSTFIDQRHLNQEIIHKSQKYTIRSRNRRSFRKKREMKILMNQRANSSTSGFLQKKIGSKLGLQRRRSNSRISEQLFHEEISSFALMNYHLEMNDNLIRLIAISIALNECRIYDDIKEYKKFYNSTIPWENKDFYKERSLLKEYNEKNIPSWLGLKNDIRFNNIQFKIQSFSPFVFHHIRLIDNISIDDMLLSLDPINNIKKIKALKVTGGRGNNCIINTWDKKFIIKTVNSTERKILIEKMIVDYHCLMKESNSLLSRIYGMYKIELKDKGTINIMVQRNMNDLPLHTKLLTFDFKGSTVDRQVINEMDVKLNKIELVKKYKNTVLKDIDLGIIDLKFIINSNDCQQLMSIIDSDSMFLQNYEVTDYSLLVFVHKYRKEDIKNNKYTTRIIPSKDNKYIFNFSIVDFLGPFNFEKKGEKLAKELVGYIKKLKDTNFSVLDPNRYAKRFRSFAKRIIIDG